MRKHEAEGVRASAPHTPSGRTIAVTLPIPTHVENFSDLAPLFAVPDNQAARLPGDYLRACARFVEDRLTDALNALLLCPGSGPWSKELTAVSSLCCAVLDLEHEARHRLSAAKETTNAKEA